ncbi:MAG: VOC family protein [Bacteroidota bacterium]
MPQLNAYLTFGGNCREAMNYYKDCLGGELTFMVVKDTPLAGQMPPQYHDQILHSVLKTDAFEIMATDMTPETLTEGSSIHLCLVYNDETEARNMWEKLADGGNVKQPFSEMFFGWIGTFTDKFGKHWIIECNKN